MSVQQHDLVTSGRVRVSGERGGGACGTWALWQYRHTGTGAGSGVLGLVWYQLAGSRYTGFDVQPSALWTIHTRNS